MSGGAKKPRESQEAMHDGKARFSNLGRATLVSLSMQDRHGQRFTVYPCEFGETGRHWHVGTPVGEGITRILDEVDSLTKKDRWL